MKSKKAVFFDRDDTIIVDINYLHRPEDVRYFADTMEALKLFDSMGFEKIIITNQSGVGRKMFPIEDVYRVYEKIQNDLENAGVKKFLDMAVCPHHPDDQCPCRKPAGKMILDMCAKWGIDPTKSYMIGDKLIDVQTGENAGVASFLVQYKSNGLTLLEIAQKIKKSATTP